MFNKIAGCKLLTTLTIKRVTKLQILAVHSSEEIFDYYGGGLQLALSYFSLELLGMPEFKWMIIIIIEGLIFMPVLDVTLFNMRCHDIRLDCCVLPESC
jgi:hypothetical protein